MKRILIIEDDLMYQKVIEQQIKDLYPQYIFEIHSNPTAVSDTMGNDVLLVICDYDLGGMITGLDILKAIKDTYPSVEVIMLSGSFEIEKRKECIQNDAFDYIHKDTALDKEGFFNLKKSIDTIVYVDKKITELEARLTKGNR